MSLALAVFGPLITGTVQARGAESAKGYTLSVQTDRADALYSVGETVRFTIRLRDAGGKPVAGKTVPYKLSRDGVGTLDSGTARTGAQPIVVEGALKKPGFLRLDARFETSNGDTVRAAGGAGIDPTRIPPSMPVPEGFDAYWQAHRQRIHQNLDQTPPVLTAVDAPKPGVACFDVQIALPEGYAFRGVSAYYARPTDAEPGTLPAILFVHGAGVRSSNLDRAAQAASNGMIAMDLNAHGIPNGQPDQFYRDLAEGALSDYRSRGHDDPQRIYFLGMYLRLMRAMWFLKNQPQWDGRALLVYGSSQGGGQAIAAAGLDPDVSWIAANVPALCDHTGFVKDRPVGWPRLVPRAERDDLDGPAVRVPRLFDGMNFAARAEPDTEAIFGVGFIDTTCPPTCVYATYNQWRGPKQMINRPHMGHAIPRDLEEMYMEAAKAHVRRISHASEDQQDSLEDR